MTMMNRKKVNSEKDIERQCKICFDNAMVEYRKKEYGKALELLTEAILMKSEIEPPRSCSKYYLYRGNCFKSLMEYDKLSCMTIFFLIGLVFWLNANLSLCPFH